MNYFLKILPRKLKKKFKKEQDRRLGLNILKGRKIVTISRDKFYKRYERKKPHIALSYINGIKVSTVFFPYGKIAGYHFETMVFGGELDGEQWRYMTYDQAEKGHKLILDRVKRLLKPYEI